MSDRMFVATRKGMFTLSRSGKGACRWSISGTAFLSDPIYIVLHDARDDSVYAALGHGHFGSKLHRSSDGGVTWQEIAAPAYPEKPEDVEDVLCPMRGTPIPWNLELIWSLAAGGADEPGVLWCGTVPGGLFRSEDHGQSWSLIRSLWDHPSRKNWFGGGLDYPGMHSICVDPRDSQRVTVGISCGGVWVTGDGGNSWSCQSKGMWAAYMPPERKDDVDIQDPHLVVQCGSSPDAFWSQHHNGVFRSADGCQSWTEVKNVQPSTFGFAVAVHPHDANTAWLVPAIKDEQRIPVDAQVVVSRTRDGGETFDVLREGLPQDHAYDITFRHALDVDACGEEVAFGSTTGSLWWSGDQGDHWHTISNHLPPIYGVWFAK